MVWHLHSPGLKGPTLLDVILAEFELAVRGGAAFAFASAQGIRTLTAEPAFSEFIKKAEFDVVIGLDAITNTKSVEELRKLQKSYPNFKPKLFLHGIPGSLFHPKTMWLRAADGGGVIVTGSGNLTSGGLKSNWEATTVERLAPTEMDAAEKLWQAWLKSHAKVLLDLDDPKVAERAKANERLRAKLKKALKAPAAETAEVEAEIDAATQTAQEVEQELQLNPVLLAEIPAGSTRWEQANFDKKSFVEFFGVVLGKPKSVHFYHVQPDGTLVSEKVRPPVAVKSRNYRFELGAAKGIPYPKTGVPIAVFERVSDSDFHYVLLLPSETGHQAIKNFLDKNYPKKTRVLRRVQTTAGELKAIWPDCPLLK